MSAQETKDAELIATAMLLFCEVSGMNAENQHRENHGQAVAYCDDSYGIASDKLDKMMKDRGETP